MNEKWLSLTLTKIFFIAIIIGLVVLCFVTWLTPNEITFLIIEDRGNICVYEDNEDGTYTLVTCNYLHAEVDDVLCKTDKEWCGE